MLVLWVMVGLGRPEVNARYAERNVPLFWREDRNGNGEPDAAELVQLWGVTGPTGDGGDAAVKKELAQVLPALVYTDASVFSGEEERLFVTRILEVARLVDRLYAVQMGAAELQALLPPAPAHHALFFRNHGPWCQLSDCNAIASKPAKISSLYPSALQTPGFCDALLKHPYARALFHPFSVVRGDGDALKPVPYHIVYSGEMEAVSKGLRAAAETLPAHEEALRSYLLAAAQAFRDNQWQVADEAWVKTAASRWYVRVAPDEVYADPCGRKAVFSLTFGMKSDSSAQWQTLLEPHKQAMEDTIATLAGAPYKKREVTFRLPDFIDVVLNAGDARLPYGATVGQSLPVFGSVAKEGRRRTVAMANLFVDPDSIALQKKQAESVFCPSVLTHFGGTGRMKIMSTVLHEAAHNLGPTGFYQVDGKTSPLIFGGNMSLLLSELHAQTAALFFAEWLVKKELLKPEEAMEAHVRDLHWAFEQIARDSKPYGQLGAIQLGWLLREGGLTWRAQDKSASGEQGCLAVAALEPAIASLTAHVSRIKAKGDKAAAEALLAEMTGPSVVRAAITERFKRFPKTTFVYAIGGL